ncbi:MAG: hypothetical protein V8R01_06680 [Bacilli bacterium]
MNKEDILKKIKAIILISWFILTIILSIYIGFTNEKMFEQIETLIFLSLRFNLAFIFSDKDILEMELW